MTTPDHRRPKHAFSIDVEDWFQVWALEQAISRENWPGYELRVERNVDRLLALLDKHDAKATWFTLGWIAERCPKMIRSIVDQGHELASHGWDHTKVHAQDAETFRADVIRTKTTLEELSGQSVIGYRAAGFSIGPDTPFAYDVLAETGHLYSSSAHPIAHDHYGDVDGQRSPHKVFDGFVELPVATCEIFGRRISSGGGGWFRAMPYALSRHLWKRMERQLGQGIFYLHPWEIDPDQPRVSGVSIKSQLRHRLNLDKMEGKVEKLLSAHRFCRIDDAFSAQIADASSAVKAA